MNFLEALKAAIDGDMWLRAAGTRGYGIYWDARSRSWRSSVGPSEHVSIATPEELLGEWEAVDARTLAAEIAEATA